MAQSMKDLNVAILVLDGFEQIELTAPRQALQEQGVRTVIVSARREPVQGMNHDEKADRIEVDLTFAEADPHNFDGALVPGGVINGDEIRMHPKAQAFVRAIDEKGKALGVICHGPWLLISAGLAANRKLTSWPSLQDDLMNAGADWVNREVVVDDNLVTSRKPDDIPAFIKKFLNVLAQKSNRAAPR